MREKKYTGNTAFLVVDVQNDFCSGGALAVPKGEAVVPVINKLSPLFENVILSQDWHPRGHYSFASAHECREPMQTTAMDYGEQVLWPDHCVQSTEGAAFHPELDTQKARLILRKGFREEIDSYSTFYENDQKTATGLAGYLQSCGIDTLYIAGLATDFCVQWSVLDALREGFAVTVIEDGIRGIDVEGSLDRAMEAMEKAGARFAVSESLLS